jgi:hypothetical protein
LLHSALLNAGAGQVLAHAPQFWLSVLVFKHWPPQSVSPASHTI